MIGSTSDDRILRTPPKQRAITLPELLAPLEDGPELVGSPSSMSVPDISPMTRSVISNCLQATKL